MPAHMMGLPVSATAPKIVFKGEDYSLLLDTDTFDRLGEDGDIPIIPLSGGTEFVGEVLGGDFHKGWEVGISTFTATIDSGILRMTGVATTPGTGKSGWINSHHLVPMLDELEVTVAMEVPVDITGAPNRDIQYEFYLKQDKDELNPSTDNNYFCIYTNVDDATGLRLFITKNVLGAGAVTLASGKDYLMAGDRGVGDLEATIWRFVFNGKPGTVGATLSIHLKQSDTLANAETATENEIVGSPFDVSDWAFNIGYPSYRIWTENDTYFGTTYDSADRAESTYLRVAYPPSFRVPYDFVDADYGKGDVELWDGDPSLATSQRVYDEDHEFVNDPYIQNGLIRLHVDEAIIRGLKLYGYYGGSWNIPFDWMRFAALTSGVELDYPHLLNIVYVSPEKIILNIKITDTTTNDDNIYLISYFILERGSRYIVVQPNLIYPSQNLRSRYYNLSSMYRFGYAGNNKLGDADLAITGTNPVFTDNILMGFDDDKDAVLMLFSSNKHPTSSLRANIGSILTIIEYDRNELENTNLIYGLSPFSNNSELFEEAEDATITAATRSYLDGEGNCIDSVCENHPDRVGGIDIDGDAFGFWTAVDDCVVSQMTTYGLKMEGTESSKVVVAAVPVGAWSFDHVYGAPQNWNAEDQIGFWWYGQNTSDTLHLYLLDNAAGNHTENFTDDFTGWRWITFAKALFTAGGVDFTVITEIEIGCTAPANSPGETYYCDYVNMYTSNTDTLWAATANCAVDATETVNASVGTYCFKATSSGVGQVIATCTPTTTLGKLIKFDNLQLYLHRAGAVPANVIIRLIDADGDYLWISQAITAAAAPYTIPLPHSATDLQGWTEVLTPDYATLTAVALEWTAAGAGEIVYIDGLREYIGTTTTRGRGETLSGEAVVLDAQGEYVEYTPTLGTHLPAGRYLVAIRAKDTDQVATDLRKYCYDDTDDEYRNQEGIYADNALTNAFDYYTMFAFVSDADAAATDTSRFPNVLKRTITENTMFIDYMLIIPIGNGKDWPQDLAHSALRGITPRRRLCVR